MARSTALFSFGQKLSFVKSLTRTAASAPQPAAVDVDPEWATAEPYSQIPGPRPLPIPLFGNFWRFLPPGEWLVIFYQSQRLRDKIFPSGIQIIIQLLLLSGQFAGKKMDEINLMMYKEYGPIVKFGGVGRPDMILLYDPEDAEKVR